MNDKQIRLEILLDYYKAMRNQTRIPLQENSEKLRDIAKKDYDFNYGYLVKHYLVDGQSHYSTDGIEHITPNGGITGSGMDIVETFIDNCIDDVKKVENKIIDNALSYLDKITELLIIWSKNAELYQNAWELLTNLIN